MRGRSACRLVLLLLLVSAGCSSDRQYRREAALLRAEILDVQDQYAFLLAKYKRTAAELEEITGKKVDDHTFDLLPGGYSAPMLEDDGVIYHDIIGSGAIIENSPAATPQTAPPAGDAGAQSDSVKLNAPLAGHRRGAVSISRIAINPTLTRGRNIDQQPGDEGIDLMIQSFDADNRIQTVAGNLTVSLIDPEAPVGQRRIGLWEFTPEETNLFFVNDELVDRGILLHLPWASSLPTRPRLTVHVQFETPAGKEFKAQSEVRIQPPSADYSQDAPEVRRWTQTDARWKTADATGRTPKMTPTRPQWRPVR